MTPLPETLPVVSEVCNKATVVETTSCVVDCVSGTVVDNMSAPTRFIVQRLSTSDISHILLKLLQNEQPTSCVLVILQLNATRIRPTTTSTTTQAVFVYIKATVSNKYVRMNYCRRSKRCIVHSQHHKETT